MLTPVWWIWIAFKTKRFRLCAHLPFVIWAPDISSLHLLFGIKSISSPPAQDTTLPAFIETVKYNGQSFSRVFIAFNIFARLHYLQRVQRDGLQSCVNHLQPNIIVLYLLYGVNIPTKFLLICSADECTERIPLLRNVPNWTQYRLCVRKTTDWLVTLHLRLRCMNRA